MLRTRQKPELYSPEVVTREPLASHFPELEDVLRGREAYLFREDLADTTGTFKRLGAVARIKAFQLEMLRCGVQLSDQQVATASAGNHARGVISGLARYGMRGIIGVPTTAPPEKSSKLMDLWTSYGRDPQDLEIIKTGKTFNDTYKDIKQEFPCVPFAEPFNDLIVARNNGRVLLNAAYNTPWLKHVFAPTGGGGLQYGMAYFAQGTDIRTWAAQATGSDSLSRSLRTGSQIPVEASSPNPRFGGVAVTHVGNIPLAGLRGLEFDPARIVTVEDEEAVRLAGMYERHRPATPLEPTSLLAVAALIQALPRIPRDEAIGVIATGHNESYTNLLAA